MLRADIEKQMKSNKQTSIVILTNASDKLGMYCTLSSGYLTDCWGHRVDRKKDIWGFIEYINGVAHIKDFAGTVDKIRIREV